MCEEMESLEFKFERHKDDQRIVDEVIDSFFESHESLPSPIRKIFNMST